MDTGTISSLGIGSSFDSASIVSKLMDIERIPLERLIQNKNNYDAKISALGSIKSALSSFQTALDGLKSGASFQASSATSSNDALVTATGTTGAVVGNYSIEVSQLAQSQKIVAAGQADATAFIGDGTLTIDLGTISGGTFDAVTGTYSGATFSPNANGSFSITIDSSNDSLEGIRDAINGANAGVSATIVNDGDPTNPYRLVLSSTNSGSSESIRIGVTGDAALSSLLSQDPAGTQNLSQKVTAQDALFTVDGISITKASNTVTDVIQGVTLGLGGLTAGTSVGISVSQDTATAKTDVEAFVKAYNDLRAEVNKQTDSSASDGAGGALASDFATRQILDSVKAQMTQAVTGLTGTYTTLTSIGVSFQQDGTIALDGATLEAAIKDDSQNISDLFSSADGYGTRLDTVVSEMLSFTGTIASRTEGFEQRVSDLEAQQVNLEGRLDRTEQRLRAQFSVLDSLLSSMTSTSNFLTQQLANA